MNAARRMSPAVVPISKWRWRPRRRGLMGWLSGRRGTFVAVLDSTPLAVAPKVFLSHPSCRPIRVDVSGYSDGRTNEHCPSTGRASGILDGSPDSKSLFGKGLRAGLRVPSGKGAAEAGSLTRN